MVVQIFAHATNAVATHLTTAAVGVVHLHARMSSIRGADEDQPVPADAGTAVTNFLRYHSRVGYLGGEGVHVDVVVAGTMHFGEWELHTRVLRTE